MISLRTCKDVTLPLSVRSFATAAGLTGPISIRSLIRKKGSKTRVFRVGILRYSWQMPSAASAPAQWSDTQVQEIFLSENGWSIEQYWWRATMGLYEIVGQLFPWGVIPGAQATLDGDRSDVNTLVRQQAASDGHDLSRFDRVCTLIHQPPGDRGATAVGGDLVLDEGPFSFEFFQHEFGHLLGFDHTFGLDNSGTPIPYTDDFDIMGNTNPNARVIPAPPALAALPLPPNTNFWRSGRRLSAASLYRYVDAFKNSPSVVRINGSTTRVRLVAVTHARFGDPVVAVVSTSSGEIAIEYRTRDGDDAGMAAPPAPLVVMHSIGRRTLPEGRHHEVNPIIPEGDIPCTFGRRVVTREGDVAATIVSISGDTYSVTLKIDKI